MPQTMHEDVGSLILRSSPSRTYVIVCRDGKWRFYHRVITLPLSYKQEVKADAAHDGVENGVPYVNVQYENHADKAIWYFLNVVDCVAYAETAMPFEEFVQLKIVNETTFLGAPRNPEELIKAFAKSVRGIYNSAIVMRLKQFRYWF